MTIRKDDGGGTSLVGGAAFVGRANVRIKALKRCVASGGRLEPGQVAEVSDADASVLIRLGQAEAVSEGAAITEPDPPIADPPPPDVTDDDDDDDLEDE